MALPAVHKRSWALALARGYARRTLRRRIDGVHIIGIDNVRDAVARGPLLFAANHVSWWDAFALVVVDEALGTDGFVLMEEANLRRLPFFSALGALAIDLQHPRRAVLQLQQAAHLLRGPRRALWIFPQGEQRPARAPLQFRRGVVHLAARARCPVVPVSIQLLWRRQPVPTLVIGLHPPLELEGSELVSALERQIAHDFEDFEDRAARNTLPPAWVPGRSRSAERGVGARVLAHLQGAP